MSSLLTSLPFLDDVDLEGQRVFLRADFNLPMDDNGSMVDDGRLRAVLPTINYLLDRGARVIIGSHLRNPLDQVKSPGSDEAGRRLSPAEASPAHSRTSSSPAAGDARGLKTAGRRPDPQLSLAPLARRLSRLWEVEVKFVGQAVGPEAVKAASELAPGRVLLLENLRFNPGEIDNDPDFARQLAELADIYVNDALGVCHRNHASMTTLPALAGSAVAGFALKSELRALSRALTDPARPLGAVIGGQNIEAKLPVLTKFMDLADYVFLGGTMGDAFARFTYGLDTSQLNLSPESMKVIAGLTANFKDYRAKLFMPVDMVVVPVDGWRGNAVTVAGQNLTPDLISEDIGLSTRILYREVLALCRTIIWNGPMGTFETPSFARGTALVTRALADCQGVTLAGGVDTSAAILKMYDRSQVSFLSAGGSAFLKALAGEPLVALEALLQREKKP